MDQWIIFLLRLIKENDLIQLYLKFKKNIVKPVLRGHLLDTAKAILKEVQFA